MGESIFHVNRYMLLKGSSRVCVVDFEFEGDSHDRVVMGSSEVRGLSAGVP